MGHSHSSYVSITFMGHAAGISAYNRSAWSGFTYQKPSTPVSTQAKPFEDTHLPRDDTWRPYIHPTQMDGTDLPERHGYRLLTSSSQAKLYRIIHETLLVYCSNQNKVSAQTLLGLYDRYVAWKESSPPGLANIGQDELLPHVFFLQ